MNPVNNELKEITDKLDRLINGNLVLKANAIKAEVRMLRVKVATKDPRGNKSQHITEILDGIDNDMNALIQKYAGKPNPK